MPFWSNMGFQFISSAMNSELESLHDLVSVWLVVILVIALLIGFKINLSLNVTNMNQESMMLEVSWTLVPILILISIALPSIFLLNYQDTTLVAPNWSIKLTSNQWNWQSEQVEVVDHLLDAEKIDELSSFDNPVILPGFKNTRILLTSTDVLHSLGIPSLGIKLDSVPGRLNAVSTEPIHLGLLTGSCYELCGSGHSAMPIYFLMI